jgi:hypothetical protein
MTQMTQMTRDQALDGILDRAPVGLPVGLRRAFWALGVLGLLALFAGLALGRPAWSAQALLVATLVLAGVSQAGIVWSAIIQITNARWGRSFRRLMELGLVGAPLALLGLVVLFATSGAWAPFAHLHLEGGKGVWLSLPFWAVRNLAGVLLLFGLSLVYFYHCVRPDLGLASERGKPYPGWLATRWTRDWLGAEQEIARATRKRDVLAPILCLAYAVVYSLLAFDLVMALDVQWYSTLFGAYHFIGNVYLALAIVILWSVALKRRLGPGEFFSAKHLGILGALLFAFAFLHGDFFWSQFLTIYYGHLPEETEYLVMRTLDPALPYAPLAWAVLVGFFGIPFVTLLFRAVKWVPARLASVAGVVLVSLIGERFLTAAPPLLGLEAGAAAAEMWIPLGLAVLASLGFLGLAGLGVGFLLGRLPAMALSDPLLLESLKDTEDRR